MPWTISSETCEDPHLPLINFAAREINYKIVYYGCGLCGKTTNLRVHPPQDQSGGAGASW